MIRFEKFINALAQKANWISAFCVLAMMGLTVLDVMLRLFRVPIPGTYEIVGLLGAVMTSFALGYTSIEKGHIAVEFLAQKMSPRGRTVMTGINEAIAMIFFIIISWRAFLYAGDLKASGEVSLTVQLPTYPFVMGLAIGSLLLAFVLFAELLKSINGVDK